MRQSVTPNEVVIADDGSGPETETVVKEMQAAAEKHFRIVHVWQKDIGFRKPRIINKAVMQASGDYLIFIDGDCMAHRDFISTHIRHSSPDVALCGRRVEIGKALTDRLIQRDEVMNNINLHLLISSMSKDPFHSRRVLEAIPIKSAMLRRLMHRDRIPKDGLWGCNFSLYKNLFIAINGCDEDFVDGSIEDNDIGVRVQNYGGRLKSVRGLAIVFHLWHASTWSFNNDKYQHNLSILKRRMEQREPVCKNGIRKLL